MQAFKVSSDEAFLNVLGADELNVWGFDCGFWDVLLPVDDVTGVEDVDDWEAVGAEAEEVVDVGPAAADGADLVVSFELSRGTSDRGTARLASTFDF